MGSSGDYFKLTRIPRLLRLFRFTRIIKMFKKISIDKVYDNIEIYIGLSVGMRRMLTFFL